MEVFLRVLKEKLFGPNVRVLITPLGAIVVLVLLLVYVLKTGYSQISLRLSDLKAAEKDKAILEQKLEILREIEEGILAQTDVSLIVMPDKNSGLWTISQLKSGAEDSSVALFNTILGSESQEGGLTKMHLGTKVTGDLSSVINFLKSIDSYAPVSSLDEVNIAGEQGSFTASTKMSIYWAELPTKLPPLTEPIKRLTPDEEELLAQISQLERPSFTVLKPTEPRLRETPF